MDQKFQVIIADPPFEFGDQLKMNAVKRGAQANYSTMTIAEIASLPVNGLADPDGALLALWVPSSLIQDGLNIMKAWGFHVKQTYVWVKVKKEPLGQLTTSLIKGVKKNLKLGPFDALQFVNIKNLWQQVMSSFNLKDMLSFGLGRLFRQTHEICLIGTNNNKIYQQLMNKSQRSICFATNIKHSAKPEALQDSLEMMFPNANYCELFARRSRKNWVTLGNQNPSTFGEDIRVSIDRLL